MIEARQSYSTGDDGMSPRDDRPQETIPARPVDRVTQALTSHEAILEALFQALLAAEAEGCGQQATDRQVINAVETAVHRLA